MWLPIRSSQEYPEAKTGLQYRFYRRELMITRREFVIGIAGVTAAGAFAKPKSDDKLIAP
jgi:hypothetical protein